MINVPKGTKDVLPSESHVWQYLEREARAVAALFNAHEIRTPTFEHTELFLRGVGDTTDVVNKEMYTFTDKADRSITLKPEGTAGVARAYIENNLGAGAAPTKMFYITPVFRYEKPQAGRLREHHQFGVEFYGSASPLMDAEAIALAKFYLDRVGVTDLELHVNSIGCPTCRKAYNAALVEYFSARKDKICPTCVERLEKNPLRLLDCKVPECKAIAADAPLITDYLCQDCRAHMDTLLSLLDEEGIACTVDPRIVRGLDYYTRTVFEFVTTAIGAQGTVCGGGRYDNLVGSLGGAPTPAVGFGMGLERLQLVLAACGAQLPEPAPVTAYFVGIGEDGARAARALTRECRHRGISAECDKMGRSVKAQFKYADKLAARFVVTVGPDELASGTASVRDMRASEQVSVPLARLADWIAERP